MPDWIFKGAFLAKATKFNKKSGFAKNNQIDNKMLLLDTKKVSRRLLMKITLLVSHIESSRPHLLKFAEKYLDELSSCLGFRLDPGSAEQVSRESFTAVLVSSGGTLGDFKELLKSTKGPYILLSTPYDNSIPCCLEIMYLLNERGLKGEILYGSVQAIAKRFLQIHAAINAIRKVSLMHLGIIGCNAEDLSDFSVADLSSTLGAKLSFVGMEDLRREIGLCRYEDCPSTDALMAKAGSPLQRDEIRRALFIYGALKRIIKAQGLDAIALKCFDLLDTGSTGCLALSILNKEGIVSACEADARSLVSMVILNAVSSQPCFMANPCNVDAEKGTMTFAHCTLPLDMTQSYELSTHFESGLSVAIKGVFGPGDYTVFKCRESLLAYSVKKGVFASSPSCPLNCRTQLELFIDGIQGMMTRPINNHQIICIGDYCTELNEFIKWARPISPNRCTMIEDSASY